MRAKLYSAESILEALGQGPARIEVATDGIAGELLIERLAPGEWSAVEILAHLRASADVRGDQRIAGMLADREPIIRTVSPRNWPPTETYVALPFGESLASFADQRSALLRRLRALSAAEWQRGATLTGLGNRRYETVQSEADALARHEASHLAQIEHLSPRYRAEGERRSDPSTS